MSDIAIRVENLSKRYTIGVQPRHDTLRDALVSVFRREVAGGDRTAIWALKGISFEVRRGEVLGIIGRNGAGKSTLLKILARVTEPTEGRATIHGRVGSLLEVGTGFHPELTGRENIYLNGAILGMRRAEIRAKFDQIVAFSEIEKFLDTPVKRYSSGMYVRLAFAVAAHLEPEILLVDEVLAVGDAVFQKKCLGKMSQVAGVGRTVLFVSHNMSAIQRLCGRTVLLDRGELQMCGDTSEVVATYLSQGAETILPGRWMSLKSEDAWPIKGASFTAVKYSSGRKELEDHAFVDGPLQVSLRIASDTDREVGSMAVILYDEHGTKLVNCDTIALGRSVCLKPGPNEFTIRIAELHLNPGRYTLGLWLANPPHSVFDRVDAAARIEVLEAPGPIGNTRPQQDGAVSCDFELDDGKRVET